MPTFRFTQLTRSLAFAPVYSPESAFQPTSGGIQYAIYVPLFGRLFPSAAAFAAKPFRDKLADPRGMAVVAAQAR